MPGWKNSKPLGVAMTSDSAGVRERGVVAGIGGEINTRDTHAVILAFYHGATSGPTRRVLRDVVDRSRRSSSNALRVPPPARRVLAAK